MKKLIGRIRSMAILWIMMKVKEMISPKSTKEPICTIINDQFLSDINIYHHS